MSGEPSGWEPVIGLEIHVQLNTDSKMFCRCENRFGDEPNTRTCPVCLGHPGALPTINARGGREGDPDRARAGLRHRRPEPVSPQELLLSRQPEGVPDQPVRRADLRARPPRSSTATRIGITRAHLEEDAAKLVHAGGAGGRIAGAESSVVDFNRCGTPLVEIVTEPDIRSPEQALAFLGLLKNTLQTIGRLGLRHGEGVAALRRQRLGPAARRDRARDEDRAQEHELVQVPGRGDGGRDRAPDRAARGGRARCCRRRCTTTQPSASCTRAGRRRRPTTTGTSRSPTSCRSSRRARTSSGCAPALPELPGRADRAVPRRARARGARRRRPERDARDRRVLRGRRRGRRRPQGGVRLGAKPAGSGGGACRRARLAELIGLISAGTITATIAKQVYALLEAEPGADPAELVERARPRDGRRLVRARRARRRRSSTPTRRSWSSSAAARTA